MPKIVDPAARRRAVAEAVLRVVARGGLEGASLRNVAEEAGLAVGSVRHYFADHDELMIFTMEELGSRIGQRVREHVDALLNPAPGADRRARTEELLAEFLPLDDVRRQEAVLWLTFTAAAHTRPELRPYAVQLQDDMRALMARVLTEARQAGGLPQALDVELESVRLAALLDGLTLQAVLQPDRMPADLLRRIVAGHLGALGHGA